MKKYFIIVLAALLSLEAAAQYPIMIHSHNDYTRVVPFYEAYSQKLASIECDMFYVGGGIFLVGHDVEDLDPSMTFDKLYLNPVLDLFKKNGGHAWADDPDRILQLLLEIKSADSAAYLKALDKKLSKYPEVFNPDVNPAACRIVITGNIPPLEDFVKYPSYIKFDYHTPDGLTTGQLDRIAMISYNFEAYSGWNGKGTLVPDQEVVIRELIAKVHAIGKPIRFWGAPDSVTAWYTFLNFGIDYMNTDHPEMCCEFFSNWDNKNYSILGAHKQVKAGITRTDRLDKITRDFEGFRNEKLQLSEPIPTYTPTYLNDGARKKVKNVIVFVGDGMGISQMIAADRVNFGLSMMNMKYMGMVNNSSMDGFTTCSAASGSALSTGVRHYNRQIAGNWDGTPNQSLAEFFHERGMATGVVTLGDLADATPAACYAHYHERDSADVITRGLLDGKLTLLAGSGEKYMCPEGRHDGLDMHVELEKRGYKYVSSISQIDPSAQKVICVDEQMDKAACAENVGLLADCTRRTLEKLSAAGGDKGFYVMIEGAKIDYAGHSRCLPGSVVETLSLDLAIKEALEFADKNGETLVIVTADHECGALILVDGDLQTGRVTGYYLSNDHTPIYPIVLSYGPHSNDFIGRYPQYDIANRIKALFNE